MTCEKLQYKILVVLVTEPRSCHVLPIVSYVSQGTSVLYTVRSVLSVLGEGLQLREDEVQ